MQAQLIASPAMLGKVLAQLLGWGAGRGGGTGAAGMACFLHPRKCEMLAGGTGWGGINRLCSLGGCALKEGRRGEGCVQASTLSHWGHPRSLWGGVVRKHLSGDPDVHLNYPNAGTANIGALTLGGCQRHGVSNPHSAPGKWLVLCISFSQMRGGRTDKESYVYKILGL